MSASIEELVALKSWVECPADTDFPIQNLPYGVFSVGADAKRTIGVALGDKIVDLSVLASAGLFKDIASLKGGAVFQESTLNAFMRVGRAAWIEARTRLTDLLKVGGSNDLSNNADLVKTALVPRASATMHMPAQIGDYTDFYASRNHAYNVGVMFRGPDNALQPNWTSLPVGYHGRASSVVVSGTELRRPKGQLTGPTNEPPAVHGECKTLDFELELGFFVGTGNNLGEPMEITNAWENIFGVVLMNDWSARDIQKWEYVPLGPFGAKNFGTTISPWVVTTLALEPFRIPNQVQEPQPLEYLREVTNTALDINLEVTMTPRETGVEHTLTTTNAKYLYWTFAQMLAHHTVTGCNMQPGDLLGSGTISGPTEAEYGSLLELTWKGSKTITLGETTRKFIQDGDVVTIKGNANKYGFKVGFGECSGKIIPAYKKA